jgi:hypothetical protein
LQNHFIGAIILSLIGRYRQREARAPLFLVSLGNSEAIVFGGTADLLWQLCSLKKLEIHTVFLRFSNFHLPQNLSPPTFADFIRASLEKGMCK